MALRAGTRLATAVLLFILAGCASPRDKADTLVHDGGWQWNIVSAGKFDMATAQPSKQHGDILWVFIEGDGLAFLSPTRPSVDPTPGDPIALRLALANPESVPRAYLARPCQYVLPDHGRGCARAYWTSDRYAPEVIASTNAALYILKAQTGARHLILVGYSGGGAVAVLAAAKRNDVAGIITIAANLDLAYWAKRDGLTPLTGSLNPADAAHDVVNIPQVHFTGEIDKIVGTDVAREYMRRLPADAPAKLIEVPGFTHKCCWADKWSELIASPDVKSILSAP